ncbi:MAG: glycosyltransferase family 2 protein [Candidatus Woesearchaeota archaeon]|nr:MAG: glycosyltransferase family 2 protein [Candidatus Woesearchaeota archaeon]
MKELSVIVPVYNESESVKKTLEDLKEVLKGVKNLKYEIIVIEDKSTDDSYNVLKKISGIKLLQHKVNRGYGASLKTGMNNSKYDYILITDSDGSYPMKEIPNLLKYIPDYDMVIGNRHKKSVPFLRRFPKWVLRVLASFLSKNKVLDLNSGLRIFKKIIAKEFWKLLPERFSFTSTMTMACFTHNYPVKYVPISYHKRSGSSSIHPIKDTLRFFSLLLRLTMYFNPLRFFIPLALLFGLLGLLRGLRDLILQNSFGGLTLVLFFMAFQIFFFGLIADIINKK